MKNKINHMSVAFYIAPYINAICRSGSIEEKNLTEEQILNFIETKINNTAIDVNRKIKPKVFPQELLAQEVSKLING